MKVQESNFSCTFLKGSVMRIFTILLSLFISGFISANELDTDHDLFEYEVSLAATQFLSSGMVNNAPVLYIWDEKGKPEFIYEIKTMRAVFLNQINAEQDPLTESELKGFYFLESYLSDAVVTNDDTNKGFWNTGKKVFLLHVIDPQVSTCLACEEAENLLKKFNKESRPAIVFIKTQMTY